MSTGWRTFIRAGPALVTALASFAFTWQVEAETMASGEALYLEECSKCHGRIAESRKTTRHPAGINLATLTAPALAFSLPYGPNLAGVLGRQAGSVPGYDYSKAFLVAMQDAVWDTATLDEYLTDTQLLVPGSRMYYSQPDGSIRQRIVTYLASTGDTAGGARRDVALSATTIRSRGVVADWPGAEIRPLRRRRWQASLQ